MRLLICAGGTGGGVYPALAVLQALGSEASPTLWVGGMGGMEMDLVKRAGVPFTAIPAAGVHGVGLRALPQNLWRLSQGVVASRRILRQFQPEALLFTGGYVGVPMALAGLRLPALVYVPDIEPGLALKVISRLADRIAVTVDDSRAFFSGSRNVLVSGYPTRPDLASWERFSARQSLGLQDGLPAVLVFGGSKGARSINQAVFAILPSLLGTAQVIHVTGQLDWQEVAPVQAALPARFAGRYHPVPYLHEMGAALAAADLAVSRAGASTLGELPLFGLPAILVPYPYAWRYQKVNAHYLENHGAATVLEDARLTQDLLPALQSLLSDPDRLAAMRTAMRGLARPQAAAAIAGVLREMVSTRRQ